MHNVPVSRIIAIDFETYSAAPLPSVGLANYVADPTFRPTVVAVATDTGVSSMDFVLADPAVVTAALRATLTKPDTIVVAYNAGFEEAVLRHLGIDVMVYDSAVVAAVAGANRHLAGAARQLLDENKLDEDGKLLRTFAMPQPDQADLAFDIQLVHDNPDLWLKFHEYCRRDAVLARRIYVEWASEPGLHRREMMFAQVTQQMNATGWPVDVDAARAMLDRYRRNLEEIEETFAEKVDPDLNLASHTQVSRWCADRGVTSRSFDKQHVDKLIAKLKNRPTLTINQVQVLQMLYTKRELGGTSPKKLETILDTQHKGRLYDQYVHAGAAQTLRTSGRSVQMQNLPRLGATIRDMSSLDDEAVDWTNDKLSENLRQLFRASHPQGELVVADYASIESRALAWLANEDWKLDAYRQGQDVYKMQAVKIFSLPSPDVVDKSQRQTGKVGELSCGYGAGPGAVKDFAEKMGVLMSEGEAKRLVYDWRDANPRTVALWHRVHDALVALMTTPVTTTHAPLNDGSYDLAFSKVGTPKSLLRQAEADGLEVSSVQMSLVDGKTGQVILQRMFHGCYLRGNNIAFYKPSALKTGDPWKMRYVDPKTGLNRRYELYGGKLVGILTQSLCRELFFRDLLSFSNILSAYDNVRLIGQFHDEIVVEWEPGALSLKRLHDIMRDKMSQSQLLPDLPMAVEVKHAHRYIK